MTPPPAAAAAAPTVAPRRSGARAGSARGSASPVRAPRRVSGPAKPRAAARRSTSATAGGAIALPAPGGLALGALQTLSDLAQHRWLDRLIRGRTWIALVAFALIGIVAMQLWIVKLGVGIGRALETEGRLQRENAALSVQDAQASSGERIERLAAARNMVAAAPGSQRFLHSHGELDARRAAAVLAHAGQVSAAGTATTSTTSSSSGSEASVTSGETTASSGAASGSEGEAEAAESAGTTAGAPEGAGAAAGTNATSTTGTSATSAAGTSSASGAEEQAGAGSGVSAGGASASGEATAAATGATSTEGGTGPGG